MSTANTTLATRDLGNNVLLRGLRAPRAAATIEYTDDGLARVLLAGVEGGRALELTGHFTRALIDQLMDVSAMLLPVALIHPRGTFEVFILGTDMEEWVEYVDADPDDILEGKILLLEA